MANILWFRRGDGQLFCAEEGTAQFQLMSKSGEFEEVIETFEAGDDEQPRTAINQNVLDEGFEPMPIYEEDASPENVESQPQKPVVADAGKTGDSGQSRAGKRGGARSGNKTKGSQEQSGG